jgi:hypothetical protein
MIIYEVSLDAMALITVRAKDEQEASEKALKILQESKESPTNWIVTAVKDVLAVYPDSD